MSSPPLSQRGGAALAIAKAHADQDAADAPATLRAYASDLKAYEPWCARQGMTALPAAPVVVGANLAAAGEGYAMQTFRRRVAAIARASGLQGHSLDTKHPSIRETLRRIGRTHGSRGRRAAALTTPDLRTLVAGCDASLTGNRDQALLLIGFAGALRRSELVALDVESLAWSEIGVKLLLEWSKTDKEGEGAEVMIVGGRQDSTCPVWALRRWLDAAGLRPGPVFRKVNKAGRVETRRLSEDAVRQILRRVAARTGVTGSLAEPVSPQPSGRLRHDSLPQRRL